MIRISILFMVSVYVGNAIPTSSWASESCPSSKVRSCKCPEGCDGSYCEQIGILITDKYPICTYRWRDCSCGGYGQLERPVPFARMARLISLLDFASTAWATESAQKGPRSRDVSTPFGEFTIDDYSTGDPAIDDPGFTGLKVGTTEDGEIVVKGVAKDSPADKAKLKKGQVITFINGKSTYKMSLETALKELRGQGGTFATIRIKQRFRRDRKVSLMRVREAHTPPAVSKEEKSHIETISLKELGVEECPAMHGQCHFLLDSHDGKDCRYICEGTD